MRVAHAAPLVHAMRPRPAARASVSAIATAVPTASPGRVAVAAATPARSAPTVAATGPVIYSVSASPNVAHPGDAIVWDAHVSPDVVAVRCRVAVYSFDLYPVRYGHFGETLKIPKDVPAIFHGRYGVTITATSKTGATASRGISLLFE